MPVQLEMTLRLLLAAVLGGIIGFQREMWGKTSRPPDISPYRSRFGTIRGDFDAGLCRGNPSMIAAGVVTGVGFLGAGAILHRHGGVEGLTTAATIWVAAGVGLAAGAGLYILAPAVTAMAVIILLLPQKKAK